MQHLLVPADVPVFFLSFPISRVTSNDRSVKPKDQSVIICIALSVMIYCQPTENQKRHTKCGGNVGKEVVPNKIK